MDTRTFVISTASTLSLALTSGCADPIIGSWELKSVAYEDGTMEYPYTYEGGGYTVSMTGLMTIGEDLSGSFVLSYEATFEGETESGAYTSEVGAAKTAKGQYDITLTNEDDVQTLSCTLGESLVCTGEDSTITFAEAEE